MKYHLKPKETIDLDRTELSSNDIEILFLELVKAGNISGLQQAASYFKSSHNSVAESATMYAAKIGSMPMLEILTQFIGPKGNAEDTEWLFDSQPMYRAVVRSENVEVFRWYLRQLTLKHEYGISHFRLFVAEATATDSPDVYSTWENFLLDPTLEVDKGYMGPESQASRSIPRHWKTSPIFSHPIFNAIKGNLFLECRLIQTWHRLNDSLDGNALSPLFLGWSLVELAQSNKCSLSLARELLNLGALIDFPQGKAVRNAAKKIVSASPLKVRLKVGNLVDLVNNIDVLMNSRTIKRHTKAGQPSTMRHAVHRRNRHFSYDSCWKTGPTHAMDSPAPSRCMKRVCNILKGG
jgi:hypothetical protein